MPENITTVTAESASEKSYWEFWKLRRERSHLLTDPGEIGDDMPQLRKPSGMTEYAAPRQNSAFAATASAPRFNRA
jgi:hypothetical protein